MSEPATSGWRARITDENAVIVAAILVALPSVVLIAEFFGGATSVVFLVTLAVGTVPGITYSSHWPRDYAPAVAALWGLGAALVVLAVMTGITIALEPLVAVDGAVVVAFVLVSLAPYLGGKVLK